MSRAQNTSSIAIPFSIPKRSFTSPTRYGPTMPPTPPTAKKLPSRILGFFEGIPETTVVAVGKMIENPKPVNARKIAADDGPKIPTERNSPDSAVKSSRLSICPNLSTNRLPSSRPTVMPTK